MSEYYFTRDDSDEKTLYLAPLTDRRISMSGQSIADPSGYFLYEKRGNGEMAEVEILAQILSEDAAFKLKDLLGLD